MKTVKIMYTLAIMSSLMLLVFAGRPAVGAWTDEGLYMKTTDQGVVVDSTVKAYLNLDRGTKSEDAWLGFKSAGAYNWLIGTGRTGYNSDLSFCSYAYNAWSTPLYLEYATGHIGIGTTSPIAELDIRDSADVGSAASLALRGSGENSNCYIDFYEGSTLSMYLGYIGAEDYLRIYPSVVFKKTGDVGIGTLSPEVPLHVVGGSDASPAGGGYIISGETTGRNIVIDNNEIMSRDNGVETPLYINKEGGNVYICKDDGAVSIGAPFAAYKLAVEGSNGGLIATFENTSSNELASGMDIRLNRAAPGTENNFIQFFGNLLGSAGLVGEIEGNGTGGVTYRSVGSDFAEFLPRFQADEVIEAGDIVGISGGKVSKITREAELVQVVSTAPIVLGNDPGEERERLCEKVAFLGRAPVKVRGEVRSGDYIVPSGLHDGIGRAVSPKELSPAHHSQIVGRAWESSDKKEVKLIDTAVGLHASSRALFELSWAKDRQIEDLTARVDSLERMLKEMKE